MLLARPGQAAKRSPTADQRFNVQSRFGMPPLAKTGREKEREREEEQVQVQCTGTGTGMKKIKGSYCYRMRFQCQTKCWGRIRSNWVLLHTVFSMVSLHIV